MTKSTTWLPELADNVWPDLPEEVAVSEEEQKKRRDAKYAPVNLKPGEFEKRPFPQEVIDLVKTGVEVLFLGDKEKFEQVEQYAFKEVEHKAECVKECERAIACDAISEPPEGVRVSKIHSWVVVVKGGRTRICLDTSKLLNPYVPSIPFNLPQFDDDIRCD